MGNQINKPNTHFNPVLYTGNATDNTAITGLGFQPDLTWIKSRTGTAYDHRNFDIVRGAGKRIGTNKTDAEATVANELKSFDSDGFTLGTSVAVNGLANFVSWNWKAGGTAVSNTDGDITSSVSANTDSGFSVVTWTGTGANATVGHGLNSVPSIIILKNRIDAIQWRVYHASLGATKAIFLDLTNPADTLTAYWNDTTPTSSVFSLGNDNGTNGSGDGMVAYCFAEKKGFSKFGSYVGNGSADGTFVYTGFKPAFVMLKSSSNVTEWIMHDNDRLGYNGGNQPLFPNNSGAEDANSRIDLLSNGFKLKDSSVHWNGSGYSFIYLAIAESPIVGTNGVPATAR